jgi:putative phage-type endonuclease
MMIEKIDPGLRTLTDAEMIALHRTSIGGSKAPVIMGESRFETPLMLWARSFPFVPPKEQTPAMARGRMLERAARARYERDFGIPMPARVKFHPDIPYMHGNFDGLNLDARGAIEIKAPGKTDHVKALNGEIPSGYLWQCLHYLAVAPEIDWIDYFSYYPKFKDGPETARIRVTRNARRERELLAAEKKFHRCVVTRTPPPPGPKELPWPWPKYADAWKQFLKGEPMKHVTPNPGIAPLTKGDIVELAKELKALGLRSFQLADLTLDFQGHAATLGPPETKPAVQSNVMNPAPARPVCECGAEKIPRKAPKKGFWCFECYKTEQKAKGLWVD